MVSLLVLHFAGSDHTIVDGQEVFKLTVFSHFVIDMFNTIRVKKVQLNINQPIATSH